jgi:DeoR/GlpR family transcriptional regulator of sugar metabolism
MRRGVRSSSKRRDEILRLATGDGLASVDELAERFGVTASTIRRDLAELSSTGRIARTYGGAMAIPLAGESSLNQRNGVAPEAKRAIGRWAANEIGDRSTVLLDAGTTVARVARYLPRRQQVEVTTASIPVIGYLQARDDVTLNCLGGRLRALSDAFVGPMTEAALERMSFDLAFLGADGVTSDGGVCEAEPEQTRLKELMARRSRRVFLLVHAAKLNQRPFHSWARMDGNWTIVTDSGAPAATIDEFRAAGRDVIVVPPEA